MSSKLSSAIYKLSIGVKLSLDEVEKAFNIAIKNAIMDKSDQDQEVELARIDILTDKTVVYLRGNEAIANYLKTVLKKQSPEAKFSIAQTTTKALANAL